MGIFKACDIRGRYPAELHEGHADKIGRAMGTLLGSGSLLVGGDLRLSTLTLKAALISGLLESGCGVIDIGTVPTPVFYYARRKLHVDPGLMVTASHNPPEYNGFKVVLSSLPVTEEEILKIRELTEGDAFRSGSGRLDEIDIMADYEEFILEQGTQLIHGVPHLPRVVLDCGNGSYSTVGPRVFEALGIPVHPLFCHPDGSFPNRSPNCALASSLRALRRVVVEQQAHLGIAFDGDGDRVSFVDETGAVLGADAAIGIMVQNMPTKIGQGEGVVLDIKCSMAVAEVVRSVGASALIEKSGHTFIKRRMVTERAAFGGEISGHYFYRELDGGDDGLYSALLMTGIVGRHGLLSQLAKQIPRYAATPDIRVPCVPDPLMFETIAGAFPADRVSRLDGVRVQFQNGWGLARPSVTEPVVTLRFEGNDAIALEKIIAEFLTPVPMLREAIERTSSSGIRGPKCSEKVCSGGDPDSDED